MRRRRFDLMKAKERRVLGVVIAAVGLMGFVPLSVDAFIEAWHAFNDPLLSNPSSFGWWFVGLGFVSAFFAVVLAVIGFYYAGLIPKRKSRKAERV
jgi:uncharacterized BrkB/YihY/UPF0761 family membrane protein